MATNYTFSKGTIWASGKLQEIELGQRVFVGHCGSGRSVFGELGKVTRITETRITYTTDSGKKIQTAADNMYKVIGKAGRQGNWVSLNIGIVDGPEFYHSALFVY